MAIPDDFEAKCRILWEDIEGAEKLANELELHYVCGVLLALLAAMKRSPQALERLGVMTSIYCRAELAREKDK